MCEREEIRARLSSLDRAKLSQFLSKSLRSCRRVRGWFCLVVCDIRLSLLMNVTESKSLRRKSLKRGLVDSVIEFQYMFPFSLPLNVVEVGLPIINRLYVHIPLDICSNLTHRSIDFRVKAPYLHRALARDISMLLSRSRNVCEER